MYESYNDLQFAVFSPDAERVATSGIGPSISIWDVRSGKKIVSLAAKTENVFTVAFSPDGKKLASVYDNDRTLKSWDTTTGQELSSLKADNKLSYRIAFSPDGTTLAAACDNGNVILWNIDTGQSVPIKAHNGVVSTIAFSSDGLKLATGGKDNAVKLWDVKTGRKLLDMGQAESIISRNLFTRRQKSDHRQY